MYTPPGPTDPIPELHWDQVTEAEHEEYEFAEVVETEAVDGWSIETAEAEAEIADALETELNSWTDIEDFLEQDEF